MTSVEEVRAERERREAVAKLRASRLPAADYYAAGPFVMRRGAHDAVFECETHWDACLVILSTQKA